MKKVRVQLIGLIVLSSIFLIPNHAEAQFSIGGSYQIRNQAPEHGFGVQIKQQIFQKIPVLDISLRAHFSYFSKENSLSKDGISFGKVTHYSFGLDAILGVNLWIVRPYVGLGIASNKERIDADDKVFWNTFAGAELTLIPILHPFVEYRFEPTEKLIIDKPYDFDTGRLVIGLLFAF